MLYAFILGRVYTLSLAEVLRVLEKEGIGHTLKTVAPEIALIETEEKLPAQKIQSLLGGTIKIVEIVDTLNRKKKDWPSDLLKDYLDFKVLSQKYLKQTSSKIQIGVSIYVMDTEVRLPFSEPKRVAQLLKKYLQSHDMSVRFVMPEAPSNNLPSVVVTNNHLLEKGAEFVVLLGRQNLTLGKTLTVQDFEDYGRRDYQRPFRDLKMGMLPPKVAQVMINFSGAKPGETILDPFCGGGTVLQEALLMNIGAVGSDIDVNAVHGAEANLTWFRNRYHIAPGKYEILKLDATSELSREFKPGDFEAIVTEGWLGPLYTEFPKDEQIKTNFKNLRDVYIKAFEEFKKIIKPGGKIVICLPAYRLEKHKYIFFPSLDFIEALGYSIEAPLTKELIEKYQFLRITERNSIVYERKEQIVAREIFILTSNSQ